MLNVGFSFNFPGGQRGLKIVHLLRLIPGSPLVYGCLLSYNEFRYDVSADDIFLSHASSALVLSTH